MSASRVVPIGAGDENADQDKCFASWTKKLWNQLEFDEKQLRDNMKDNTVNDVVYSDEEDNNDSNAEPLVSYFILIIFFILINEF